MPALSDYSAAAGALKDLVGSLGVQKEELQGIVAKGPSNNTQVDQALAAVAQLTASLQQQSQTLAVTEAERQRKMAELQSQIDLLRLLDANSPDFDERMEAEREISRLTAILGTYQGTATLHFDQLLTDDGHQLGDALKQAAKDISARQDLTRVLKGIEVVLRAGAFAATVATKLAVAAAA